MLQIIFLPLNFVRGKFTLILELKLFLHIFLSGHSVLDNNYVPIYWEILRGSINLLYLLYYYGLGSSCMLGIDFAPYNGK